MFLRRSHRDVANLAGGIRMIGALPGVLDTDLQRHAALATAEVPLRRTDDALVDRVTDVLMGARISGGLDHDILEHVTQDRNERLVGEVDPVLPAHRWNLDRGAD
jgi:hypothetical protein